MGSPPVAVSQCRPCSVLTSGDQDYCFPPTHISSLSMNILHSVCLVLLASVSCISAHKGPHYKVHCSEDSLRVDMVKHEDVSAVYLNHLKDYPDPACKPEIEGSRATFLLSLENIYQCMVTRVEDRNTGRKVFYHRVVVEYGDKAPKDVFLVKCDTGYSTGHGLNGTADVEVEPLSVVKRQAEFPANFREDYDVLIDEDVVEGHAPVPVLNVGVRQSGTLIDNELNVKPGTPLNMEVYLDTVSAKVYGLMVTGMEVTDTKDQNEPILVNGCSVDPYLFENFQTQDGDFLKAKFRAFKFPQSSFVLFKGTVNVCLDSCLGVTCSNGQRGFGRKKRSVHEGGDPNKVYEISMSTVIKMECDDCSKAKYMEKETVSHIREKICELRVLLLLQPFPPLPSLLPLGVSVSVPAMGPVIAQYRIHAVNLGLY